MYIIYIYIIFTYFIFDIFNVKYMDIYLSQFQPDVKTLKSVKFTE